MACASARGLCGPGLKEAVFSQIMEILGVLARLDFFGKEPVHSLRHDAQGKQCKRDGATENRRGKSACARFHGQGANLEARIVLGARAAQAGSCRGFNRRLRRIRVRLRTEAGWCRELCGHAARVRQSLVGIACGRRGQGS